MKSIDEFNNDFIYNIHVFLDLLEMTLKNCLKMRDRHIFGRLNFRVKNIFQYIGLINSKKFPIDQGQMLIFN